MKKFAYIAPLFVLGFLTYWGFAWFCTDWDISNAPIRTLVGIIDAIGEPVFCNLAIIGSIGFPIYIVLYFAIIRKKLKQMPNNRINSDWQFRCAPLPAGYAERSPDTAGGCVRGKPR